MTRHFRAHTVCGAQCAFDSLARPAKQLCNVPISGSIAVFFLLHSHKDNVQGDGASLIARIHLPQISHALRQSDLLGPPLAASVPHVLRRLDLGNILQNDIADPYNADDGTCDNPYGWLVQQYRADKDVD